MVDALTIEHDGKKYVRDNPSIACVSTDFRERITWSQSWDGEPPKRVLYLSGSARLEASTLAVLESPDSRADVMSLSIRAVEPEIVADQCRNIDLRSESALGDPKPETIAHAWPLVVGYIAPDPELPYREHDWFCEIYVPEGVFEQLRAAAKEAARLELRVQVPTYGEEVAVHFGGNERTMFFPGGKYGSPGVHGRCEGIAFVGANKSGVADPEDQDAPPSMPGLLSSIDSRLDTMNAQMKTIREALLVLAGAAVVSAVALYFR